MSLSEYAFDRREPGVPSTPGAAINERDELGAAMAAAIRTVEDRMTVAFVREMQHEFRVPFASPPLGGSEGWVDNRVVQYVIETYEDLGWNVAVDRHNIVFTPDHQRP